MAAGVLYRSSGLTRSSARSRILSVSQSSSAVRVTDWSSVSVLTAECEAGAVVVSFLSAGVPRPGAPSGVWGVEEGEGSVFGTGRLHLVVLQALLSRATYSKYRDMEVKCLAQGHNVILHSQESIRQPSD